MTNFKGKNGLEFQLELKTVKIPIAEYEKDMETELSKEKKKEILDLRRKKINKVDKKSHFKKKKKKKKKRILAD